MDAFYFDALKAALNNYNLVTFGFLAATLLLILIWYYWKFLKPYSEFPTFNMIGYIIYMIIIKRVSITDSFANIVFQELIAVTKRYESEGIVYFWGFPTFLLVFGADSTKTILMENKLPHKASFYKQLKVLGSGLVTSNGETWKKHRKLFAPVFHADMLKKNIKLYNEYAKILVKSLTEAKESPVIILDFLKPCAFGIICESILGLHVHSDKHHKDLAMEYLHQIVKLNDYFNQKLVYPWLQFKCISRFTSFGREARKLREDHDRILNQMIFYTKESLSEKEDEYDSESKSHKFFAQILLREHLKDPSFTMKNVRDQMNTFVGAGYDTLSYTMMWCLFFLGHHQEIQERVYSEVESGTEDFVTFDNICNLKYMESVLLETLRLRSTIPFYGRQCQEDIKLGKYTVPKNTDIIFFTYALHRDPKNFPNPEKFDPDRFLEEKSAVQNFEFAPFATGSRECIGKKFAMWEMKVVLSHVLRKFKIVSLDKIEDISVGWEIVLTPSSPIRVQLIEREL